MSAGPSAALVLAIDARYSVLSCRPNPSGDLDSQCNRGHRQACFVRVSCAYHHQQDVHGTCSSDCTCEWIGQLDVAIGHRALSPGPHTRECSRTVAHFANVTLCQYKGDVIIDSISALPLQDIADSNSKTLFTQHRAAQRAVELRAPVACKQAPSTFWTLIDVCAWDSPVCLSLTRPSSCKSEACSHALRKLLGSGQVAATAQTPLAAPGFWLQQHGIRADVGVSFSFFLFFSANHYSHSFQASSTPARLGRGAGAPTPLPGDDPSWQLSGLTNL